MRVPAPRPARPRRARVGSGEPPGPRAPARAGVAGGGAGTGTVKLVDGSNVYVTDTSGNVVKILTNDGSTLTKTDPATTKDIAPGSTVIVRGTPNSDGSYTATPLIISSPAAT